MDIYLDRMEGLNRVSRIECAYIFQAWDIQVTTVEYIP